MDVKIEIEAHLHIHSGVAEDGMLQKLDEKLTELATQQKRGFMAVREDIKKFASDADKATSEIGARIDKLVAASSGLTDEEKAEFARLTAALNAMGKDADNPFPPLPPPNS